jgi:hypothetical protein
MSAAIPQSFALLATASRVFTTFILPCNHGYFELKNHYGCWQILINRQKYWYVWIGRCVTWILSKKYIIISMILVANCTRLLKLSKIIQSDLDTTRLYTTRTSVIRGFCSESWYPNLFRVFEPNCRRYVGIANMSPCEKVTLQSYNDRMMKRLSNRWVFVSVKCVHHLIEISTTTNDIYHLQSCKVKQKHSDLNYDATWTRPNSFVVTWYLPGYPGQFLLKSEQRAGAAR